MKIFNLTRPILSNASVTKQNEQVCHEANLSKFQQDAAKMIDNQFVKPDQDSGLTGAKSLIITISSDAFKKTGTKWLRI